MPVVFVTGNQHKSAEVARLLAGVELRRQKVGFPFRKAGDLVALARERVLQAHSIVGEPCFVEVTALAIEGSSTFTGAGFKKRLLEMGEAAFFAAHGGRRAVTRVVVAYSPDGDPGSIRVFEGESEGTLLTEPRGDGGHGWDRAFLPDGYTRTLGEMERNKWFVNMRWRPYLELWDVLTGRSLGGTYEAHVTVAAREEADLQHFTEACARLGVKCVYIELARGESLFQPMTASYHHGALPDVRREVDGLAQSLAAEGFDITRIKIEAVGDNHDMPRSDEEARQRRANYFEFHVKIALPSGADVAPLRALCEARGAHLSRNARKQDRAGLCERFATMRVYDEGRAAAEARFAALLEGLKATGYTLSHRLREYTVYDSNVDLDRGWLPAQIQNG